MIKKLPITIPITRFPFFFCLRQPPFDRAKGGKTLSAAFHLWLMTTFHIGTRRTHQASPDSNTPASDRYWT
ncbi:MAG: hypothetical protein LCH54_17475, partial [Bacteroidetes bacterium]|nr:hypothetical protein [Bacteroidota bacterium]